MYKRALILLVVLLIAIAGGIVWYKKHTLNSGSDVTVKKVDLKTAKGTDRLPEGFPKDIPVDLSNVKESQYMQYNNEKVTASTFTFLSTQTKEEAYSTYLNYLTNAGYQLDSQYTNKNDGYILGRKDGKRLSFAINDINGSVQIQVVYGDQK